MRRLTHARLVLAALRYFLKHEGGSIPVEDYRNLQYLIDDYQGRIDKAKPTPIRRPSTKDIP